MSFYNPFVAEAGIFRDNEVSDMIADTLAPSVTRLSAATVLV